MDVLKTKLENVLLFKPNIFRDFRGTYTEIFNKRYFEDVIKKHLGKEIEFLTDNEVFSRKNVLRGIHGDDRTWKLFGCSKGHVYIAIVNCSNGSGKFGEWDSFELSEKNKLQLLVPPRHGNGTLALSEGGMILHYKQSAYYQGAKNQFTYRFDDSRFRIEWPIKNPILSERDKLK